MKYSIHIFFVLSIILGSCAPEENIVTPDQDAWTLFSVPKNENAVYSDRVSGTELSNRKKLFNAETNIEHVYIYRDQLYVMLPESNRIVILNRASYEIMHVIDFATVSKKPIAMAFGNATTAYIIFEKDSIVQLYDILNKQIAGSIAVGAYTVDIISGIGDRQNQIFVANLASNSISQIDTRTNRVEKEYAVLQAPKFLSNDPTSTKIVYVSEGAGKTLVNNPKSIAGIGFIDIDRKIVLAQMPISTKDIDSVDAIPRGLAVTSSEWAFVPFSNGLVRVDTREYKNYTTISRKVYDGIIYNNRRREVLANADDGISVLNGNTGLVQSVLKNSSSLRKVLPQ
jgi:YVTN family beta-propeller protein